MQDINTNDFLEVFRSIARLSGWIASFFFVCQYGDRVTSRYQGIAFSIYECPWYSMPVKMAKLFPLSIAIAQQPIYIYGCFNIRCLRETFRKVCMTMSRLFDPSESSYQHCFHFYRWFMLPFLTSWFCGKLFKGLGS